MGDEHEIVLLALKIGIPFGAFMVGFLVYLETRFGKKVDKATCNANLSAIDRLEGRLIRIENQFFEKPLSKEEAIKLVAENGVKE